MWRTSRNPKAQKAFTIPELLVIIAVIVILALLVIARVQPGRARARDAKRVTEVNAIRKAVQIYYLDKGHYPTSTENEDKWCSVEEGGDNSCPGLISKLEPYLRQIPNDPLFDKGKETEEMGTDGEIYSYQYISISSGQGYKIHSYLETREVYEVYSMGDKEIAYVPPGSAPPAPSNWCISTSSSAFEFDLSVDTPDISQIDATHSLVVYDLPGSADAVVLEVDGGYNISTSSAVFEFGLNGQTPAISQINSNHYMVVYESLVGNVGHAVTLEVNTSTWVISNPGGNSIFDPNYIKEPAISQIDSTHYLAVYRGSDNDGWSTVLEVDESWNISTSSGVFVFNANDTYVPDISQIDTTHYLVAYSVTDYDGWAVVLSVTTTDWTITTSSAAFEFDVKNGDTPAISQIDTTHYLVAYRAINNRGRAVVLKVDGNYNLSTSSDSYQFATFLYTPAISQINSTHYLVAYTSLPPDWSGLSTVLEVDGSYNISTSSSAFEFDPINGEYPAIFQIDTEHYLVPYSGPGDDGWAVVLEVGTCP